MSLQQSSSTTSDLQFEINRLKNKLNETSKALSDLQSQMGLLSLRETATARALEAPSTLTMEKLPAFAATVMVELKALRALKKT